MSGAQLIMDASQAVPEYNIIRTFDEQEQEIRPAVLEALGKLFVEHEAHTHFGIFLLHRHQDLACDRVMVYSECFVDGVVMVRCQEEARGKRSVHACSFFLHKRHEFIPFEYSADLAAEHLPTLGNTFLDELAAYLVDNHLNQTLGLCRTSNSSRTWYEYLLPLGTGKIANQLAPERCGTHVTTEWAFEETDGAIGVKEVKACEKAASGAHTRT